MINHVGQQIGNYRLIKLLGYGGFADVYLGEHIYLKTLAAIKILRTELANEDVEQFRSEAQTIAHLIDPHIIRVLDFDVDNRVPLLVMDYAPNGTLRDRHPKGELLPLALVVSYVKQVASALQYAHDQKLIHRDVKPENMLIGQGNDVLLSDFGIAMVVENSRSQTTEDMVIGTMGYMSPEQIQGKTRIASDQYSLAVVVYEWLCGVRPFRGSYMEIVTQHLSTAPPSMRTYASVPSAVEWTVMKALEKDPHQRFKRVQDFSDALEQAYLASLKPNPTYADTVYSSPPRQEAPPRKEARRNAPPDVPPPRRMSDTPIVVERSKRVVKHGIRAILLSIIVGAVLLCGGGYAAFHFISAALAPAPGMGTAGAVTEANNFLQDVSHQNYTQAYSDFDPALQQQTPRSTFIQQGQQFDACHGPVSQYTQDSNPQIQNGTEKYSYTIVRPKLSQTYKLNLTLKQEAGGSWRISDYSSTQPDC
jgi:serine/threonine protein kinase